MLYMYMSMCMYQVRSPPFSLYACPQRAAPNGTIMASLIRPFALSELVIPVGHQEDVKLSGIKKTPPPPAPSAKGKHEAGFMSRNGSFSHLQRLRELRRSHESSRAASVVSTPSLSPLMLSSPKIRSHMSSPKIVAKKMVAPAVGHARAYAAFLRTKQAEQLLAAAPVRVTNASAGSSRAAAVRARGGTPGLYLRSRAQIGGRPVLPRAHRPLNRATTAGAGAHYHCAAMPVGGVRR